MNKIIKTLIVIGVIIFTAKVAYTTFANVRSQLVCDYKSQVLVTSSEAKSLKQNDLNNLLAQRYFEWFKSKTVCAGLRLEDYKIETLETTDGQHSFSMTYSVKPKYRGVSEWSAGNGSQEGGWIVHKFGFVDVQQTDEGYLIKAINTGP